MQKIPGSTSQQSEVLLILLNNFHSLQLNLQPSPLGCLRHPGVFHLSKGLATPFALSNASLQVTTDKVTTDFELTGAVNFPGLSML